MTTLDEQLRSLGIRGYYRLDDAPPPIPYNEIVVRIEMKTVSRFAVVQPLTLKSLISAGLCVHEIVQEQMPLFAPFDFDMVRPPEEKQMPLGRILERVNAFLTSFCEFVGEDPATPRCITYSARSRSDMRMKLSIHAILAVRFSSPDTLKRKMHDFKQRQPKSDVSDSIDLAIYTAPVQKRIPLTPKQSDSGDVACTVHEQWKSGFDMTCAWFTPLQRSVLAHD